MRLPFYSIVFIVLVASLLGNITTSHAQLFNKPFETEIQKKARHAPRRYRKHPVKLSNYLTRDYANDSNKVEAISYWISKNIKYDFKGLNMRYKGAFTTQKVLKKRKAICGEYSQLFTDLCTEAGVKSIVVEGYVTDFDFFDGDTLYRAEHAWSMAKVNGNWQLYDVTWAAGYVTMKNQYISHFLYRWLNVGYTTKFKFVKAYESYWINTHPMDMIYTHKPGIERFQLLANPISQSQFEGGDTVITQHLERYPEVNFKAPKVNAYYGLPTWKKCVLKADSGFSQNPNNHRINGFNYYAASMELFDKFYHEEFKIISASETDFQRLKRFCERSDAMMVLSLLDNKKDLAVKENRSATWKKDLRTTNYGILNKNKATFKRHLKEIDRIAKTHDKSVKYSKYAKRTYRLFQTKEMPVLKGATNKETVDKKKSRQLRQQIDSLIIEAQYSIKAKDSLMGFYNHSIQNSLSAFEQQNGKGYAELHGIAYGHYLWKVSVFPDIYRNTTSVYKPVAGAIQVTYDNRNMQYTQAIINGLYANQNSARVEMATYLSLMKQVLRKLKEVRKCELKAQGEQQLYEQYTQEISDAFIQFEKQTIEYQNIKINKQLRYNSYVLGRSNKYLRKEISYESHRHRSYLNYCKSIKHREDKMAKAILRQVHSIYRVVLKTEAYKLRLEQEKFGI